MSDEEPACPLPQMREKCKPQCAELFTHYQACIERIKAKGGGDCEPYYFDWLQCLDKCVMPQIMAKLK